MRSLQLLLSTTLLLSPGLAWWKPQPNTNWQIILSKPLNRTSLPSVPVIDSDLFDNPKSTWTAAKARNIKTICYFSTQYEDWRPDAAKFTSQPQNLGNSLDGWPGERWVNTRATEIRNIMRARIQEAKARGCDAIDPDNIDAYLHSGGGFGLTQSDAVDYVRFLAAEAHKLDLAVGLKNGDDIVPQLVDSVDFAVVEECQANSDLTSGSGYYDECGKYQALIKKGKAVFSIEYVEGTPSKATVQRICKNVIAKGFGVLIKHYDLAEWVVDCSKQ
ncbi:glycoside hydrolase family 114 protein [Cercospora zeae-maydis SCOH1-5]|uniref:alpha-galactosidase n=1 Tax=Cercospora zeae-maydis SCOH1-5 TaxID=717836 RepID=A0A6A6F682_9PEZI|nr:glycoside hydrolase family 114 protein [Cercospora zeae-maydis SCOH1-5]